MYILLANGMFHFFLNQYLVTLFHGQIVPLNSHIVPQYGQKFSRVFKPRAETRVLLMYIPHFSSNKPKNACFTSSFTLKLWTIWPWNGTILPWNEVTVKPWSPPPTRYAHLPLVSLLLSAEDTYPMGGGGRERGDGNKNGTSLNRRISLGSLELHVQTNLLRQGEREIVLEVGKCIRVNISIYFPNKVKLWFLYPLFSVLLRSPMQSPHWWLWKANERGWHKTVFHRWL